MIGGISGCIASFSLYPIESIKSKAQMYGELQKTKRSSFLIAYDVLKKDGFMSLYKGVEYAMMRQMVYTSLRFGMYDQGIKEIKDTKYDTIPIKLLLGLGAGSFSSFISAPFDKMIVNSQVNGKGLSSQKFSSNYVLDLWKGSSTTVMRASVINSVMMTTNNVLIPNKENWQDRLYASSVAGSMAATISLPFDIVRTRILTDKTNKYKGSIDLIKKLIKYEGISSLYKGYPMYLGRVGTQSTLLLFLAETIKNSLN